MTGRKLSKIWKIEKKEFKRIIATSVSYADVMEKSGYTRKSNARAVKKRIAEEILDITHFTHKGIYTHRNTVRNIRPLEDILRKDSYYKSSSLRKRLIGKGLLINICALCKIGPIWNGKTLVLQLDHINGTHTDNRIENLRILCPNCHSQTDTFCSKNKRREPNKCVNCLVNIKHTSVRCETCYQKTRKNKKLCKKCVDCCGIISKKAIRCQSCASIESNKNNKIVKNRPPLDQLLKEVEATSYVNVGKTYDVSDNTIRNWIKMYQKKQKLDI